MEADGSVLAVPYLWSNADEGDLRVWLHCIHTAGRRKLIFSPDTDVYHIGLTVPFGREDSDVIVQLNKPGQPDFKYVHMNNLLIAIENDPDLQLPPSIRPQVMQSMYVASGCDYVSYFCGLGKASFLATLFQYATFIAEGNDPPGSIGQVNLKEDDISLYLFLRLVGCTYFRKHTSLFAPNTPVSLFHSIENPVSTWDHHKQWLQVIERKVCLAVDYEKERVPTPEALMLHWKRCLWVQGMWKKSIQNDIDMPGRQH